ncbi:uncharacterized protein LOC141909951 [Tubulanus polymorphus]|uniref:uncharacterized protein LOC141909951 n=1 Tax=Tubulanus polymorphus TaxID=672921 RepID=UPI003DA2052A
MSQRDDTSSAGGLTMQQQQQHQQQPTICQINDRLKRTQMIRPPWRTMLHAETLHYVQTHANAIGVAEEYVCFPLLTIVAGLIGAKASLEVTDTWHEPAVLWCGLLARRGELKSTTIRYFARSLRAFEDALTRDVSTPQSSQHVLLDEAEFTPRDLARRLDANGNSMILLAEDLTTLYEDAASKSERRADERQLNAAYRGAETPALGVVGFVHPKRAVELVTGDDLDPVAARLLLVHPIERDCFMDDVAPAPKYTPPLHLVYKIVADAHRRRLLFRLSAEARDIAYDYLDELIALKKMSAGDENKRYVLANACGQFCRLALAVHTLNGAVKEAQSRHENAENLDASLSVVDNQWRTGIVGADSVRQARDLMNFLIEQKFILMGFEPATAGADEHQLNVNEHRLNVDEHHPAMNVSFDMKTGQWLTTAAGGILMPTMTKPIAYNQQVAPHIGYAVHPPPAHTAFTATKAALEAPLNVQRSLFKNYADSFHMLTYAAAQQQQQKKDHQQLEPLNLNVNYELLNASRERTPRQRSPTTTDSQSSTHSPLTTVSTTTTKHNNSLKPGRVVGREENGCYQYDFGNLLPYGAKNIRSLLTSGYLEISASLVAGRHLMPPTRTPGTENRYKTEAAVAYLHKVAELGFGTIHRTNKRSYIFKKRNYEELSDESRRILADIQVTEAAYRKVKLSIVDADKKNPLLAQIDLSNNNTNTSNANTSVLNSLIMASSTAPMTAFAVAPPLSVNGSATNSPGSTTTAEIKVENTTGIAVPPSPMIVDH